MGIAESIIKKQFDTARKQLEEAAALIMKRKLVEMKKRMVAEMDIGSTVNSAKEAELDAQKPEMKFYSFKGKKSNTPVKPMQKDQDPQMHKPMNKYHGMKYFNKPDETALEEEADMEMLDEMRFKIVKARIRGGKIQRRKKISTVPGMTFRGGKLTRMSPAERRKRKLGARKAKIKRKSKKSQSMRKRKLSMRRRKSMGM